MPGVRHYLDLGHLRRLDEYRYSAVDKSLISRYILRHYWTFAAEYLPSWLAPNAVTLIGFSAVVVNFITVAAVSPGLEGSEHGWVWALCAAGLFFYQTMDVLDGKQARKTGTSSPMGELFDHGCDALNTTLSALIQAGAMGLGSSPPLLTLCVVLPCASFFLSTWEEYHTGTLYLGYINGPVEGILIAVALLSWTAVQGSSWWSLPTGEAIGNVWFLPSTWRVNRLVMLFLTVAFLAVHLPPCLHNVYNHLAPPRRRPLTTRPPSGVNTTQPAEAYRQLLPMAIFCLLSSLWALSPRSVIMREDRQVEFFLIVCLLYGQMTSKVILAQLTKGLFPYSWALLAPLAFPAVMLNLPYLHPRVLSPAILEILYLHLTLAFSLLSYALATQAVLSAFCSYLGIRALTIPHPNAATTSSDGYAAVPTAAPRTVHQSPAIGGPVPPGSPVAHGAPGSAHEREAYPPAPASASAHAAEASARSPLRGARKWLDPLAALGGVGGGRGGAEGAEGGEGGGRKRSNTSERERGVGMGGGAGARQG
ncbi:uncharacterized protein JCM10292_004732 [Rhodotorula paludigena]|uniref:uncharacterized protein n=1 Tax=Rhodotorula paludigena TaxID=86838 RepID=UPI0031707E30